MKFKARYKPITFGTTAETATIVFLIGVTFTYIVLPSDSAERIFYYAAIGIGLSLTLSNAVDSEFDFRRLIRVDTMILWALYGLTFLEFLFPQPNVDYLLSPEMATKGTIVALFGFGGLV